MHISPFKVKVYIRIKQSSKEKIILKGSGFVKRKMIGKEVTKHELEEIKSINEVNRFSDRRREEKNVPTMQTGLNSDGTIKQEEIEPQMYELNGVKDR